MKIALNINHDDGISDGALQDQALERLILAVKNGEWTAKDRLIKTFMPVIHEIADKRGDTSKAPELLREAGRRGVLKAARKYRPSQGPHGFRIAVVDHIERAVDSAANGSFISKLFGG